MSATGASIGYFFTCASTYKIIGKEQDKNSLIKYMSLIGMILSITFMILQLIPIPGLEGVHFGKESYIMFVLWIVLGLFLNKRKI